MSNAPASKPTDTPEPELDLMPSFEKPPTIAEEVAPFDPEAMFKAAEADRARQAEIIEASERSITRERAKITAARAQIKVDDRILAARTPRTVNRSKK